MILNRQIHAEKFIIRLCKQWTCVLTCVKEREKKKIRALRVSFCCEWMQMRIEIYDSLLFVERRIKLSRWFNISTVFKFIFFVSRTARGRRAAQQGENAKTKVEIKNSYRRRYEKRCRFPSLCLFVC